MQKLTLSITSNKLAVCRLQSNDVIPSWVVRDPFFSITRTSDELSLVCSENSVPEKVRSEKGWRSIKVEGPLDFSLTGILASLTSPLAASAISIFAISTFDTDYILVKENKLDDAVKILSTFCNIVA